MGLPDLYALPLTFNPGWKAEVDAKDAPVIGADYWRTGVLVPASAHTVSVRFRPVGGQFGWILALIATMTILAVLSSESRCRGCRRTSPLDRHECDDAEDSVELAASR